MTKATSRRAYFDLWFQMVPIHDGGAMSAAAGMAPRAEAGVTQA